MVLSSSRASRRSAILGAGLALLGARGGSAGEARYRYPWIQPFAADSYVNIGIGSEAAYSSGNDYADELLQNCGGIDINLPGGYTGGAGAWNCPTWIGTEADPLTYIPPGRDAYSRGQPASAIRLPWDAVWAAFGDKSGTMDYLLAAFDQTHPRDYWLFNNPASFKSDFGTDIPRRFRNPHGYPGIHVDGRFYPGGAVMGGLQSYWDTAGNGIARYGQGNSIPVLKGADLDAGVCNRMLPCSMPPNCISQWDRNPKNDKPRDWGTDHYNCVWPCKGSDWDTSGYNPGPAIPFGSVLFIPKRVATAERLGIRTRGGRMCFEQLQNYGWLLSNQAGGHLVTYGSDDLFEDSADPRRSQTMHEYRETLVTLLPYVRIMKSWMYGLSKGERPRLPLPAGYQFDPSPEERRHHGTGKGFNPHAPVNGGGVYPPPPPDFDPALGIGDGRRAALEHDLFR